MKQKYSVLLSCVLALNVSLSSLASAQSAEDVEHLSEASGQWEGVVRFRDVFRNVASKYGRTEKDVRNMIFLPSPENLVPNEQALAAKSGKDALAALVKAGRQTSAITLHANGMKIPFGTAEESDEIFRSQGPATIIVFPALLQEVVEEPIFGEMIDKPSSYRSRFQSYLTGVMDRSYSWEKMREVDVPMSSRIKLASIDDAAGRPLVQLIILTANFGSLDTVGPIATSAGTLLRRVQKLLSILPPEAQQNLFFMGYSRGATVALDVIARANRAPEGTYPFIKNLRGMVNLAGVVYGSDLPDQIFRPLKIGLPDIIWSIPPPDPIFLMQQAYSFLSVLIKNSLDPIGNVKRLAIFVEAVNQSVNELKTSTRLRWWRENQLPAGLDVFSINGSMPVRSMITWPFADSPFFGLGMLDYVAIRPSAGRLFQLTGNYLNDGQIIDVKGRMWPGLINTFNPKQEPLRVHNLGNVATHHFGIGLRTTLKQADGQINTFPRAIMVEAIAAYALEASRPQ